MEPMATAGSRRPLARSRFSLPEAARIGYPDEQSMNLPDSRRDSHTPGTDVSRLARTHRNSPSAEGPPMTLPATHARRAVLLLALVAVASPATAAAPPIDPRERNEVAG